MKKTGAQIIVHLLEMHGIQTVAGIPGGSILPLYDELTRSKLKHILVRHEQAAGFIAQGIARTTGKPAVCLATSGPGAMNLLTSVADARCDSVPIIAITGQVNTTLIGTDAFQEADTFGLSFPITKHSIMVKSPEELLTAIPQAFAIAMNGRPGPVLIDVPRDVQLKECEFENWPKIINLTEEEVRFHTKKDALSLLIKNAADLITSAKKPVLFLGGGCNSPAASKALRSFTKEFPMPVTSSLMGLGAISKTDELFAGMVGMHGTYAANFAMHDADLIIAAGVRFDDRATGVVSKFCPSAKIIHIDIDAAEINKILPSSVSIIAKVENVFDDITKTAVKIGLAKEIQHEQETWLKLIKDTKASTHNSTMGTPEPSMKNKNFMGSINPRTFISSVPDLAQKAGISEKDLLVTTDVGQHQMWAAQYYPIKEPRTFLTSGSLGTMGFGLPTAIGAAIANPEKRVICFSGDGSIMMNLQEMATLAEQNLPVTVIVFENGTLGMVYQQQKFIFEKTYSASEFAVSPDLLKIAEGFGIEAVDADKDPQWFLKAFDSKRKNKPCFVKVRVDPEESVLPFVPGGKANIDSIRD
ncbi:MAG: biosynthetic-type acetolactate synthase large subunit [Treponema sp.]|nr:biosynthetic-type acetolactate synthase large subunit [Treponema sp.]